LDWFDSWTEEALLSVSTKFIDDIDDTGLKTEHKKALAKMCMYTHTSVESMATKFYDELRRKVYVTPKSYLDGINLYAEQLDKKREEYNIKIDRLSKGLATLDETNASV